MPLYYKGKEMKNFDLLDEFYVITKRDKDGLKTDIYIK